jgi:hypothetical protein
MNKHIMIRKGLNAELSGEKFIIEVISDAENSE